MTKHNIDIKILYAVAIIALLFSVASLSGVFAKKDDAVWRCNFAECTEYVEITGEQWAQENCAITEQGTICLATFEDGRQVQVPLEEIDLSEITATKCMSYTCTEETPYKIVNYSLEIQGN